MTQQVVHARALLPYNDTSKGRASIGLTWEQLGTNTDVNLATVATKMAGLFNDTGTIGSNALAYAISTVVSRGTNACSVEIYDVTNHLDGSPAGSPIQVTNFTLGAAVTGFGNWPEGVACVARIQAPYGTDTEFGPGARPRARDRNRIYIGPWIDGFATTETGNDVVWQSSVLTGLAAKLNSFVIGGDPVPDKTSIVQWSRKNAAVKQISSITIDPRPKYQRRRAKA